MFSQNVRSQKLTTAFWHYTSCLLLLENRHTIPFSFLLVFPAVSRRVQADTLLSLPRGFNLLLGGEGQLPSPWGCLEGGGAQGWVPLCITQDIYKKKKTLRRAPHILSLWMEMLGWGQEGFFNKTDEEMDWTDTTTPSSAPPFSLWCLDFARCVCACVRAVDHTLRRSSCAAGQSFIWIWKGYNRDGLWWRGLNPTQKSLIGHLSTHSSTRVCNNCSWFNLLMIARSWLLRYGKAGLYCSSPGFPPGCSKNHFMWRSAVFICMWMERPEF